MSHIPAASDVFRAIADPTRRAVIDYLRSGERTAAEIFKLADISKPAMSQHLKVLREAGLVTWRDEGRTRVYALEPRPLDEVYRWASQLVTDPMGHTWSIRKLPERRQSRGAH